MSNEEYWRNRAIQAEKAADTMGSVLGQLMPHVSHQGSLAYNTYERWLKWKDLRCGTIPESEANSPTGQEE